ncbi:AfsR/SARP family transcriptional regulator [Amycolatopsis vancoresmycina]|uniref:AfsR/SARP family transcriptional regulator n=1 Tax=Amycolatopsis vancoresmycina TaxID=208444 RepID=UPI00039F0EA9|nr:BTAD domain-containing putative transcriptional regulator [Amycolatopsis vancoresmycina]
MRGDTGSGVPEVRGDHGDHGPAVAVRCFGAFEVYLAGEPVVSWSAGKARSLFQYLLVNRGRVVRREKLFETLWPAAAWSSAASSLRVAVHAVRRALEPATSGRPVEIGNLAHGYRLTATDLWLDVDEFDSALREAHAAEARGSRARAVAWYRRAARLYTGDFLAGETGDWVVEQREYYRALALHALASLRADALRRDDHAEVVGLCRRILDIDPYQEETYQTLMVLHARRGELGQVRNWHRMCVRRLRDDLDVRPTETTRRIFARGVRGELRASAPATARTGRARPGTAPRPRSRPGARPASWTAGPRR